MALKEENEQKKTSTSLSKSPFSLNFNILTYYGAWPIEVNNKMIQKAYLIYQVIMFSTTLFLISSLFTDLFTVLGDIKKTSWNVCVTTIFTGSIMKSVLLNRKSNEVNDLRQKLHDDMESRTEKKDLKIQVVTVHLLKTTRKFFYACAFSFGCVWQVVRYRSKYTDEKKLPVPLYLPENVDLNDGALFDMLFVLFSVLGTTGLYFIIEQEMSMFTILLQIKREYDILLTDLLKLKNMKNSGKKNENYMPRETNPQSQIVKTRSTLKRLCIRQKTVMKYAESFDSCYNQSMVLQMLVLTILSVSIGLQFLMLSREYFAELAFQIGYLFFVLSDMYVLCFMGSTLTKQCREVGHGLYDTNWYSMDLETQKDISLMIMTSQRPPRITCLKAFDINLSTFMDIMKNVYSWLALFRQVVHMSNT